MTAVNSMGNQQDSAVVVRGLRKSYGARLALDGLDLTVPSGVVYGFLGPNGAGKTTTMRLLTGLLHPDDGRVEILGQPLSRANRRLLFQVGALVESRSFYPYLSARANLHAFGATGPKVARGRIDEVLELVGLSERSSDPVSGFSHGMKQRLGIAAALLNDPRLLVLDEPSNGLDPAGVVAMRELLRHLASTGKTVFVSSHLLAEVRQMADVVGIIATGRLVREGPIGELLADGSSIRVRVTGDELPRAVEVLTGLAGSECVAVADPEAAWLEVVLAPSQSATVNRVLSEAGIYASELRVGSSLEDLFLSLTGGSAEDHAEGTIRAPAGTPVTWEQ
jgi:ABC-2 type transport system ATP-binding protein